MAPRSASSLSPARPHACRLHLEPLRLAQGLDLGTPQKDPRRRLQSVGGRCTECWSFTTASQRRRRRDAPWGQTPWTLPISIWYFLNSFRSWRGGNSPQSHSMKSLSPWNQNQKKLRQKKKLHYPLQYSGLENSMDYIVHGIAKSWTRLSNFHFTSIIDAYRCKNP